MRKLILLLMCACGPFLAQNAQPSDLIPFGPIYCQPMNDGFRICHNSVGNRYECRIYDGRWSCTRTIWFDDHRNPYAQ